MDKKSAVQYVANVAVTAWASRGADVVKDMFVFVVCVNDDEQLRVNSTMIVRRFVWLGERQRERGCKQIQQKSPSQAKQHKEMEERGTTFCKKILQTKKDSSVKLPFVDGNDGHISDGKEMRILKSESWLVGGFCSRPALLRGDAARTLRHLLKLKPNSLHAVMHVPTNHLWPKHNAVLALLTRLCLSPIFN